MSKKRVNPRRIPMTADQARQQGQKQGLDVAMSIIFFALVNSDIIDKDKLSKLWEDVNYVSDSIVKGYINAADLKRTLREEWDIHI